MQMDRSVGEAEPAGAVRIPDTAGPKLATLMMATDLSARSDRALERAIELTRDRDARLVIVHVLDEDLPGSTQGQVEQAARDEIADTVRRAGPPVGASITIDVVPGKGFDEILSHAEAVGADLIITGIHHNETRDKPVTGTTMERVIRNGTRPVLVVPGRVAGPYRRVLVGVDFSDFSRAAIGAGMAIAPDAEFHAVHAFEVPFAGFQTGPESREEYRQEHRQELATMIEAELGGLIGAADACEKMKPVVRHGSVQAVLREEVDRLKPDLMVLGTHGRKGLSHAMLGSVAERFLNDPPCDVLVVKAV